MTQSKFVKSFDWLAANLNDRSVKAVDASWYLPAHGRDAFAEYEAAHIPGAVFFDQDAIVAPHSTLPHTLPSPELFADAVSNMGISNDDTIIVYDGLGMFSAPRVWWMFQVFGAKHVFVLNGGFDAWKSAGRPVTTEKNRITPSRFVATFNESAVVTFDTMMDIVANGTLQIADARGKGRFDGAEAEPRAGMRSGHMPGALNVPFSSLKNGDQLKPIDELATVLRAAGLDLNQPVVTTCGSGVTAAVIMLALQSVGHDANQLYDGSWAEWGGRSDTPIATRT